MYCCDRCGVQLHKGDGHSQYKFPRVVKIESQSGDIKYNLEGYTVDLCRNCALALNNQFSRDYWAASLFTERNQFCLDWIKV